MTGVWHVTWRCVTLASILFLTTAATAADSDWPTWRHDAGRTAATPHELAPRLHLQWKRDFALVKGFYHTDCLRANRGERGAQLLFDPRCLFCIPPNIRDHPFVRLPNGERAKGEQRRPPLEINGKS